MKTQLRLLSLIAALILPIAIWANVIVKGHVTYQNGQPAYYYAVHVETDSLSNVCNASHVKYTNSNAIYQDTLVCNALIAHVRVWVVDCQGNKISNYLQVPNSGVVESNFIVCYNGGCYSDFEWAPIAGSSSTIRFDSKKSTTSSLDSIISRTWIFGDGDSTYGNVITPNHHYQKSGNYTVCLYTKTKNNCQSSVCKQVNVTELAGTCHTSFTFYQSLPNPSSFNDTVHFNSSASTTAAGDSIISRSWRFNLDTLGGNIVNPTHIFTNMGTSMVCLTTISRGGCIDSFCQTIVVPRMHCMASFTYSNGPDSSFFFNAQPSVAILGDTISQYNWTFGDGATANTKDPHHKYLKPGTYQVCLTIISKKGCTDHVCNTVILLPPKNCHAQFTYLPITGTTPNVAGTIHFNGQPSTGDSITQYRWNFGDSASATTKDPYHTYTKAGNYMACLIIFSKNGCTDTTCVNITIAAPPPTTCSANFNFIDTGLNGHFNSSQINTSTGDSITNRYWNFGDGQTLSGNVISPLHHYKYGGNYQVCLKITTRLGCASEICKPVHISGDSITIHTDFLKIISVYPNPATTQFNTIIASRYNNVEATLEIYDVYGTLKWSSKKVLSQGNNNIAVSISQLISGPYIFKVTTIYGVDSKRFFKL